MNDALQLGIEYAYLLLFVWVFAEQIGFPVPSIPFLLSVGALVGAGRLNVGLALGLGLFAALLADLLLYRVGRRGGPKVLRLVCRLAAEPEACVSRSRDLFARYGARSLLVAKFVPGLNSAAAPLAGLVRMPLPRFLLFDGLGTLLWLVGYGGVGYVFSNQLEAVAAYALRLSVWLLAILVGGVSAFVAWKYIRHQHLLHKLHAPGRSHHRQWPTPVEGSR